jgi:tape measure domain-containing protein
MATVGSLVVNLILANAQFLRQMVQTQNATGAATRNMQANMAALASSFKAAGAGLAAFVVARGLKDAVVGLARYSDAWKLASNQIAAADALSGKQARSMKGILAIAAETRSSLQDTAELYARTLRSTDAVAKSEEEVAKFTIIAAKAFKTQGASMQETVNGIRQLSQAISSGVLQGDELRSLRENAPLLAQAIATEFNTTIGGLKKLGAEGKLTADRVFGAILKNGAPIEAAFKKTNATIAESFVQLNNAITAYVGKVDAATGASKAFTTAILGLSKNLDELLDSIFLVKEIGGLIENIQLTMRTIDLLGKNIDKAAEGPLVSILGRWEDWTKLNDELEESLSELIGVDLDFWIQKLNTALGRTNPFKDLRELLEADNKAIRELNDSLDALTIKAKTVTLPPLLFSIPKIMPDVTALERSPAKNTEKFLAELDLRDQIQQMGLMSKAAAQGQKDFDALTDMLAAFNDALKVGNPLVEGMAQDLMVMSFSARQAARLDQTRIALKEEQDNLNRSIGQQKLLALALNISADEYNKLKLHIDASNEAREKTIGLSQEETNALKDQIVQQKLAEESLERQKEKYEEVAQTINSTVTSSISMVSSAFADAVVEGENFRDMLDALLKDLAKLAINSVMNLFLRQILGGVGGPGTAGTGLLGGINIGGSGFHSGGIVGKDGTARSIPAALIATAPRFHDGLMTNEFAAVLKKGEGVFTPDQMSALGGKTVNNFTVINQAPNTDIKEERRENSSGGTDVIAIIRQTMTKEVSDPASSVHRSMKSTFGLSQAVTRR